MPKIGIIAGSGFCKMKGLIVRETLRLETPYGSPSDDYRLSELEGVEIVFLPRHGNPHRISPHKLNYRANIFGFKKFGVEQIVSINAVGGINPKLHAGSLVLLDQIIDQTSGREASFFNESEVVHVDFTDPYCPEMRSIFQSASRESEIGINPTGTYICTNGPRLESRAEIHMFAGMGAEVVGMTGMPEATLARELEICLASICVVTNLAAGVSGSRLTTTEVVGTMNASMDKVIQLIKAALPALASRKKRSCYCSEALKDARM